VEGRQNLDTDDRHVNFDAVSPNYFSTMRIPLLSGREFNAGDTATNTKVAIINEAMVKEFFPKRNPIGVHFALGGGNDVKPNIEIVGVVRNAKEGHVRDRERPYFYQPYSQFGKLYGMSFYARSQQDPLLIANAMRETVRGADANLPVDDLKTVERVVDEARTAMCAEAVGAMDESLKSTVEYLKTRKQFGVPIGSFQTLQHRAADMFVALEQARSMSMFATMASDFDDAKERATAVAAAKVQIGKSLKFVGQQSIQLHGGIGMTMEAKIGHYFKRLTMIENTFGDTDYHLRRVTEGGGLV